ncbi:MAG: TetR/AcrR family transcriptional regulator [Actinocrinis sp.]
MKTVDEPSTGRPAPAAAGRRPGRPRSDQAEESILDAVFALFSEGATYDGLSMEMIAAEARVGKATIYRRWPNKEALVIDAICRRLHPDKAVFESPGGPVRDDMVYLLEVMRLHLQNEATGPAYTVLAQAGSANPNLSRRYHEVVIEPRREVYRAVLRRGMATGELRPDLDVERAMVMLTSAMLSATRHHPPAEPVGREFSEGLADDLLRGAASCPELFGSKPPECVAATSAAHKAVAQAAKAAEEAAAAEGSDPPSEAAVREVNAQLSA